jgi:hypothetical protein
MYEEREAVSDASSSKGKASSPSMARAISISSLLDMMPISAAEMADVTLRGKRCW